MLYVLFCSSCCNKIDDSENNEHGNWITRGFDNVKSMLKWDRLVCPQSTHFLKKIQLIFWSNFCKISTIILVFLKNKTRFLRKFFFCFFFRISKENVAEYFACFSLEIQQELLRKFNKNWSAYSTNISKQALDDSYLEIFTNAILKLEYINNNRISQTIS